MLVWKISYITITESSRFYAASVPKGYIGLACAYALYTGAISSLNDLVTDYLPDLPMELLQGTTIRQLLTHTHGLSTEISGGFFRNF
ncbi:serine hydrolase domain-containing protein [Brevibacillus laterosporus]|uniref:serine hydrolase domain-containing protein n=1 Tax=Brevibacillus TaxID=55080 RepID=UPI0037C1810F